MGEYDDSYAMTRRPREKCGNLNEGPSIGSARVCAKEWFR